MSQEYNDQFTGMPGVDDRFARMRQLRSSSFKDLLPSKTLVLIALFGVGFLGIRSCSIGENNNPDYRSNDFAATATANMQNVLGISTMTPSVDFVIPTAIPTDDEKGILERLQDTITGKDENINKYFGSKGSEQSIEQALKSKLDYSQTYTEVNLNIQGIALEAYTNCEASGTQLGYAIDGDTNTVCRGSFVVVTSLDNSPLQSGTYTLYSKSYDPEKPSEYATVEVAQNEDGSLKSSKEFKNITFKTLTGSDVSLEHVNCFTTEGGSYVMTPESDQFLTMVDSCSDSSEGITFTQTETDASEDTDDSSEKCLTTQGDFKGSHVGTDGILYTCLQMCDTGDKKYSYWRYSDSGTQIILETSRKGSNGIIEFRTLDLTAATNNFCRK